LVVLDKRAARLNPVAELAKVSEEDKFKFKDVFSFKVSFWLLTTSCVLTYASILPYLQIVSGLLQSKYGFTPEEAGYLFGIPYIMSAVSSPFLGLLIDKIGRRALLMIISSLTLILAFGLSMHNESCDDECKSYSELPTLVLLGLGYSIYAAAIWGSVPYVVTP